MARAVRKVSRVSTKNQKREGLNKKLIAIISAIAVVILGVAVGLIVYFTTQNEEYVSEKVYFVEETYGTNQDAGTVTFVKENYYNIVRKIENEEINEHVFIFAYDGSKFYGDMEYVEQFEDAEYNAQLKIYNEYTTLIKRVADLQIAINAAVQNGVDVVLYIVDINVDNGVNAGVMTDAGKLHEEGFSPLYLSLDESINVEPAIFYLNEGVVKEKFENGKLATTKSLSKVASAINNAVNVLKSL